MGNLELGKFIVIEGGDGCGKTSVINGLKEHYKNAIFVREPGGTEFGEKVRNLIMDNPTITKETEMYLFSASRSELVDKVIKPGIINGDLIICDRFVYSSYAYQGSGANIGIANVEAVNQFALRGVVPDMVIYLKVEKSFRTNIENRLDDRSEEEKHRIFEVYNYLAEKYSEIFNVVEVQNKNQQQVLDEVISKIDQKLGITKKENKINER